MTRMPSRNAAHFAREFLPAHSGHDHVGDQQIDRAGMGCGNFQSGVAARRFEHVVASGLQKFTRHFAHVLFVFGKQHGFRAARQATRNVHHGSGSRRLVHTRQVNLEGGAFAQFAVHPDESAALLHDAVHSSET